MMKHIYKKMFKSKKTPIEKNTDDTMALKNRSISSNLEQTVSDFRRIYSYPDNSDVVFRNIHIGGFE